MSDVPSSKIANSNFNFFNRTWNNLRTLSFGKRWLVGWLVSYVITWQPLQDSIRELKTKTKDDLENYWALLKAIKRYHFSASLLDSWQPRVRRKEY